MKEKHCCLKHYCKDGWSCLLAQPTSTVLRPARLRCRFIKVNRPRRFLLLEAKFGNSHARKASLKADEDEWTKGQKKITLDK